MKSKSLKICFWAIIEYIFERCKFLASELWEKSVTVFLVIMYTVYFAYFAGKIAKRFGQKGALALLCLIPLIGSSIFWIIISNTKIVTPEESL